MILYIILLILNGKILYRPGDRHSGLSCGDLAPIPIHQQLENFSDSKAVHRPGSADSRHTLCVTRVR
jgi:hypothetical protein